MPLFCSHCGSENDNLASTCIKCGAHIGHVTGDPTSPTSSAKFSNESPLVWGATALLCGLYLIYPSLGIFELIPDSIPLVGSLDEAAATTGLLFALSKLGWNPFDRTKK